MGQAETPAYLLLLIFPTVEVDGAREPKMVGMRTLETGTAATAVVTAVVPHRDLWGILMGVGVQ